MDEKVYFRLSYETMTGDTEDFINACIERANRADCKRIIVVVDLDKFWCDGFIIRVWRETGNPDIAFGHRKSISGKVNGTFIMLRGIVVLLLSTRKLGYWNR